MKEIMDELRLEGGFSDKTCKEITEIVLSLKYQIAREVYQEWYDYTRESGRGTHIAMSWNPDPNSKNDGEFYSDWLDQQEDK